jgi:hypothetical protein
MRTAELEEMGEIASNLKIYNLIAQLREGSGFLEDRKETLGHIWETFHGKFSVSTRPKR